VYQGKVAVTPLGADLTHQATLAAMAALLA
jgi:hypothetical protein